MDNRRLTHLFFDIETIGIHSDSLILDFSAIAYHIVDDKEKTLEQLIEQNSFTAKFDATEQIGYGRVIDPGTLDWWNSQEPEAKKVLKRLPTDVSFKKFTNDLLEWFCKVNYNPNYGFAWQRGTMDIAILQHAWEKICGLPNGKTQPIIWWMVRDIRTAIDVSGKSSKFNGKVDGFDELMKTQFPGFIAHNSLHDVARDILHMRAAEIL